MSNQEATTSVRELQTLTCIVEDKELREVWDYVRTDKTEFASMWSKIKTAPRGIYRLTLTIEEVEVEVTL